MKFREMRIKAGLTLTASAKAIGVSKQAIYQWETGQRAPCAQRLPKIANVYGCTVDELLMEPDNPGARD